MNVYLTKYNSTIFSAILWNFPQQFSFLPSLPFMDIDCTDEQIKLMFKVAKRLQYTFSDVKRLTTKYLLKAKKIKAKKAELCMEREDRKKREEREAKMRDKIEEKKVRKEQERAQREIEERKEDKKKEEEQKAQPKSIFSMIKPEKSKNPTTSKSKGKQKQSTTMPGQGQQKFLQKPTQPESPYFQFLKTKRKEIRATTPNMSMAQISQIMRKIWESMTDDEKRPFVQEYELQKAKYQRDMIIYYKQPNLEMAEANRKQQEGEKDGLGDYAFLEELCQRRPDA